MLPNKWHRAAIGAAGMYVEVVMASIATFLWWFSEPGLLNHICLSVMFVCSVSTVLFNANPLLRFDGYYILSDITEIPNLRQKSSRSCSGWPQYCLGIEQPEDPFLPQSTSCSSLYTIAAVIYRWVVVISILLFLNKMFEPYGLKVVSQMLAHGPLRPVGQPMYKIGKVLLRTREDSSGETQEYLRHGGGCDGRRRSFCSCRCPTASCARCRSNPATPIR